MYAGQMVFSQFLELVSWKSFQTCVDRHRGDWKIKSFYCREFFRVMVFAQITGRESLSEIVLCLKAVSHHLYHAGIQSALTKSNLAHANNQRHWKIFYDYAQVLIRQATPLYHNDPSELDVDGCVYALDSTTIDLCLSLFPQTPNEVLQILSVTPFEKMPISSVLFGKITNPVLHWNPNQLTLFDL